MANMHLKHLFCKQRNSLYHSLEIIMSVNTEQYDITHCIYIDWFKNRYYLLISGHRCTKCVAPSERWQANLEGWLVHGPPFLMKCLYYVELMPKWSVTLKLVSSSGRYSVIVLMMNGFGCSGFILSLMYSNLSRISTLTVLSKTLVSG